MTEQPSGLLQETVRRIHATAEPDKIILFGSRARGDEQGDSDLDIFIIMDSDLPRYKRPVPIYQALAGLGVKRHCGLHTI